MSRPPSLIKKRSVCLRLAVEDLERWKRQAKSSHISLTKWISIQCNANPYFAVEPAPLPDIGLSKAEYPGPLSSPTQAMLRELQRRGMCIHGVKRGFDCTRCGGEAKVVFLNEP